MRFETSAGGLIIATKNDVTHILLIKDKSGNWTFPKGLIESGEDSETTAKREIEEEVGVRQLKFLSRLTPIEYFYRWEGALTKKKVYYYLFQNGGNENLKPQRDEGIMDVKWFPLSKTGDLIGYKKTNKPILEEAQKKLAELEKR